jgi:hypothetical protein
VHVSLERYAWSKLRNGKAAELCLIVFFALHKSSWRSERGTMKPMGRDMSPTNYFNVSGVLARHMPMPWQVLAPTPPGRDCKHSDAMKESFEWRSRRTARSQRRAPRLSSLRVQAKPVKRHSHS